MTGATAIPSARRALLAVARRGLAPVGSVVQVRTTAPDVVLTFDDGPQPGGTETVLAALADAGATATFFVLLTRVRRHSELLHEVLAAGHEVALHGADHRALTDLPPHEVRQRSRTARDELEDLIGRSVRWLRPPYGRQTPRTVLATRRAGLEPVLWSATTWDWRDVPHADRVAKAPEGVGPGLVVLGHDGWPDRIDGVDDGPAPQLDRGALVREVLDRYADRGLRGRSLVDALVHGAPVREARFRR